LPYCLSAVLLIAGISLDTSAHPIRYAGITFSASGTIADFDGDHEPDAAQSRQIGHFENGYLYRVELKLSSGASDGSLTFRHTDTLGLTILPLDVDGDHDVDLAIAGRFIGQSIGVWINDGHGSFSKGSVSLYSAFPDSSSLRPSQPSIPSPAVQNASWRHFGEAMPSKAADACNDEKGDHLFDLALVYRDNQFQRGSPHLRAPPLPTSL
jgi:hypothetical protein